MMIEIRVNGDVHRLPPGTTVADLLNVLALAGRRLAVERNLEILPRSTYHQTILASGDQLEIIEAIGGG